MAHRLIEGKRLASAIRPTPGSGRLMHQKQNAVATFPGTQIFFTKLLGKCALKFFKRPALSDLDLDWNAGIGGFGAQANIGLLLVGDMHLPLNGVGSALLHPQAVRCPPLHSVFVLKTSQGLALLEVVVMKIMLYIGKPTECDELQIARRLGLGLSGLFKGGGLARLPRGRLR